MDGRGGKQKSSCNNSDHLWKKTFAALASIPQFKISKARLTPKQLGDCHSGWVIIFRIRKSSRKSEVSTKREHFFHFGVETGNGNLSPGASALHPSIVTIKLHCIIHCTSLWTVLDRVVLKGEGLVVCWPNWEPALSLIIPYPLHPSLLPLLLQLH